MPTITPCGEVRFDVDNLKTKGVLDYRLLPPCINLQIGPACKQVTRYLLYHASLHHQAILLQTGTLWRLVSHKCLVREPSDQWLCRAPCAFCVYLLRVK